MGLISDIFATDKSMKEKVKEDTIMEFIVKDKLSTMRDGYETFYLMSNNGNIHIGGRYVENNAFVFKNVKIGDRVRFIIPYQSYQEYWSKFEIVSCGNGNK